MTDQRKQTKDDSPSAAAGYVPRYTKQGRYLDEQDTLRVMVLAIKHMDREHHDWEELMTYVDKFDASVRGT